MTRRELFQLMVERYAKYGMHVGVLSFTNEEHVTAGYNMFSVKPANDTHEFYRAVGQFKDDGYTK